jgi:hypothetical protein
MARLKNQSTFEGNIAFTAKKSCGRVGDGLIRGIQSAACPVLTVRGAVRKRTATNRVARK